MNRRTGWLVVAALVVAGACSRRQPPAEPEQSTPTPTTQPTTEPTTPADTGPTAAEIAAERAAIRASLEQMVHFDYDEARIRSDAEQVLNQKVPLLRANPSVTLRITGHADERGSTEYNLALGLRRANAVREFLSNFGVDGMRLMTETMGEDRPLEMGSNEAAWARNRRAEFAITAGGDNLTRGR